MFKFVMLYRQVDDVTAVEKFFTETHLPLFEQLPTLIKSEISRVMWKPGGKSRFYMMVEGYFESSDHLTAALVTKPGLAMMQALKPWADAGIITWFYCDTWEEDVVREDEETLGEQRI